MSTITERVKRGAALLDDRMCEGEWVSGETVRPCRAPAVGRFRRACVHEHVREAWVCSDHADRGWNSCKTCWDLDAGLSHRCPVAVTEVTG